MNKLNLVSKKTNEKSISEKKNKTKQQPTNKKSKIKYNPRLKKRLQTKRAFKYIIHIYLKEVKQQQT